jgi:hypothetical protein
MRKQRYQRSVAESKDPARVDTDTFDQDSRLLKTQLTALKSIWSDDEEKAAKKGKTHNAMAQDLKDAQNNFKKWSAAGVDMTEEELQGQLGGQAFQNSDSPLKLGIEGSLVEIADSMRDELVDKYGEENVDQNMAYLNENQPIVDKNVSFDKYAASIAAKDYTDDYWSKRGVDPLDYISKTELAQLHVDKYTQQGVEFIQSTPLNDGNIAKVTEQLSEKIEAAELPKLQAAKLKQALSTKITKYKDNKLKMFNLESEKIKSDYLTGKVSSIRDYKKLNNEDAKSVGNVMFTKKTQDLQDGNISFSRFNTIPSGERVGDVYQAKVNKHVASEYKLIKGVAADASNEFLLKPVKSVPVDQELAVELMYNYYNERKRDNPEFTLDDAKDGLYSTNSKTHIQQLLADSHRDYLDVVKDKAEYIKLLKTTSGRMELRRKAAMAKKPWARQNDDIEENNEPTRSSTERPKTY